jgi:hypothetical protein
MTLGHTSAFKDSRSLMVPNKVKGMRYECAELSFLASRTVYLCGYIVVKTYTVEFHLSGLIGVKSHPDKQKIRIIGFFFKNRLRWHLQVGKMSTNGCVRLNFYLHIYKSLIHNSLYELDNWRKI